MNKTEEIEENEFEEPHDGFGFYTISFNKCEIAIEEDKIKECIFRKTKKGKLYLYSDDLILDGKLELDKKTYDYKTNNRELFSFWFNDHYYPTMPMSNILELLEPFMYKGFKGRDIIKRVFNTLGKKKQTVKAEYILGFNNGWKLPQLEEANGYTIIQYTDYQRDAYNRAKKIIEIYSETKKNQLLKNFKRS